MFLAKHLTFMLAAVFFTITVQAENADNKDPDNIAFIDTDLPIISYVNFQSLDPVTPLTVSGQLRMPVAGAGQKLPAVIIVHGSAGVDSRGKFYAEALNDAGIATLEIDLWAARGWLGSITGRPRGVPETLPDAYGALKFLAEQPGIDPERIGIMGFSWGGVVTMLTATKPYGALYSGGVLKFAAHLAHYPICWVYNRVPGYAFNAFTGAPLLIQAAAQDGYDAPNTCANLLKSLPAPDQSFISLNMYQKATHAWDRLQPAQTVTDPYSHLGLGGQVQFTPDVEKAVLARNRALAFFEKVFGIQETISED